MATAAMVLVGGGWLLAGVVKSPAQRAADAAPPAPSLVTAAVEFRVLAEKVVTRGDIVASGSVSAPASAGVVTKLPVARGGSVSAGSVVAEVAGRPVLVLVGAAPVFRDMRPGQSGTDVRQLQDGLRALGYTTAESDGVFGPGTKTAVLDWYRAVGYDAKLTAEDLPAQLAAAARRVRDAQGALDAAKATYAKAGASIPRSVRLGLDAQVADAEAAVDAATSSAASNLAQAQADRDAAAAAFAAIEATGDRTSPAHTDAKAKLTAADSRLASVRRDGDAAVSAAQRGLDAANAARDEGVTGRDRSEEHRAVISAEETLAAEKASQAALDTTSGPMVPLGEVLFVPVAPVVVDQLTGKVGEVPAAGWLQLASADLVVSTVLSSASKALLPIGASVAMDDEVSGVALTGKLTSVADELTSGESGRSGYAAVVTADSPIESKLSGRNVRVSITGARSESETLVAPLTAVFTRADATTVVTKQTTDGTVDVPVKAGLSAGGFVAIEPTVAGAVVAGDRVVVSLAEDRATKR